MIKIQQTKPPTPMSQIPNKGKVMIRTPFGTFAEGSALRVYTRPTKLITGQVVRYKAEHTGPSPFDLMPGVTMVYEGRFMGIQQPGAFTGSLEYLCLEIKGQKAKIVDGKIKGWGKGTKVQSIATGIIEKVEAVKD